MYRQKDRKKERKKEKKKERKKKERKQQERKKERKIDRYPKVDRLFQIDYFFAQIMLDVCHKKC